MKTHCGYIYTQFGYKTLAIDRRDGFTLMQFHDGSVAWFLDRWVERDFRPILSIFT
jgi:hypothetical protein